VVEETVKEMLPINQILKTYLHKNPMDRLQEESEEAHTAELGDEEFPGDGELPVPEETENEESEVVDHGEGVPPPMPEEESAMPEEEEPMEETKNFTFKENLIKRTDPSPGPSMDQDEDFSINPGANR